MKKSRTLKRMAHHILVRRGYHDDDDDTIRDLKSVIPLELGYVTDWLVRDLVHVIIAVSDDPKMVDPMLDAARARSRMCRSQPIIIRLADIRDPGRMAMRIKEIADRLREVNT